MAGKVFYVNFDVEWTKNSSTFSWRGVLHRESTAIFYMTDRVDRTIKCRSENQVFNLKKWVARLSREQRKGNMESMF